MRKSLGPVDCRLILLSISVILILIFSPSGPEKAHAAAYDDFAQKVLQKYLSGGAITQREKLLLMAQPQEFNSLITAWNVRGGEKFVNEVLQMRRTIFNRALARLRVPPSKDVQAVIALGSWAKALNAGDMDVLMKAGQETAAEFNQLLSEEITKVFGEESDDLVKQFLSDGATFTVETFEIYVSTFEDFGNETFIKTYMEAMDMAIAGNVDAATELIKSRADEIIRKNLKAQSWAAAHGEYYPGVSGQDFVRRYFNTQDKARVWIMSPSGPLSEVEKGLTIGSISPKIIEEWGLSLTQLSDTYQFPVIANEYTEWVLRSGRGAREQAKGLLRAMKSRPGQEQFMRLLSEEEKRVFACAKIIEGITRENTEAIQGWLRKFNLDDATFNRVGENVLWKLLEHSNEVSIRNIESTVAAGLQNAKLAEEGKDLAKMQKELLRIKDYMQSHEQLAGLSKLDSKTLKRLAEELPKDLAFYKQWQALYELMAEGITMEADDALLMARRLVQIAVSQGRMSADDGLKALQALRRGEKISAEAEQIIAVLRRELSELASVRAVTTEVETLSDCLRILQQWSKNPNRLVLSPEVEAMVNELAHMSDIQLLRMGFKDSEIALLKQIHKARLEGMNPSSLTSKLKAKSPGHWKSSLRALVAIGGGIAIYQTIRILNDPAIPEDQLDKAIAETMYSIFPTIGLILEGAPLAVDAAVQGYDVDWQGLGTGVALSALEIIGIASPTGGLVAIGALATYGSYKVYEAVTTAEQDRQFITALYRSLKDKTTMNELKVQGGALSFDINGLSVVPNVGSKSADIIHSPAFVDMYTDKGNVMLDTGSGRLFTMTVREALRDYAKRNVWANNKDLQFWEGAVRRYFPDIDLNEVESWKLGEVSEQGATVTGRQFKVGAHLVRRYLNTRNMLTESTIRHLKLRVADMVNVMESTGEWEKQMREIEQKLSMEEKILPHVKEDVESFWDFVTTAALSSATRLEQVGGIWKRYIKTYGEAATLHEKWGKVFESVELSIPPASDLFGLSGVESEEKPRIEKVYQDFQTAYGKAGEEFRKAKGGPPDMNDSFDSGAWKRLLSLRLRLFISHGNIKSTPQRTGALEKEITEVLEEIRNHYASKDKAAEEAEKKAKEEADKKADLEAKEKAEKERSEKEKAEKEKAEEEAKKKETEKKEVPACSYKYTDWGECSGATKRQSRTVTGKEPQGCVEKEKPSLEQGCTPPPTEEEKRLNFLSCLCRACGGSAGGYYNTGDSCGGARPCACWGVFNCWSAPIPRGADLIKSCYSSAYGIREPGSDDLSKALNEAKKENRKHMKPLKANLNFDKCPIHAQLGDIVNFSVSLEGGIPPHTVSWSGEGEAKDNTFIFAKSRQPGSHTISVTVNDDDGNSATASCQVIVDAITVEIEKTSPAENTLPIGGTASFRAVVKSGQNSAGGELKFLWQPHPEVQFGDEKHPLFETTSPNTTATYTKTGTFPMWVQVLKKIGEAYQTVGESEQIPIEITLPKLKLTVDKKAPYIGDTVVVSAHEEPKMSDDVISFWWEIKGDAENPGPLPNMPNNRAYSFRPKNTKPVTVTVHAKSKEKGDDLGSEGISITAKAYNVSISEPKYHGPKPKIWRCDTQLGGECPGLVEVSDQQFAVHHDIFMKATVTPSLADARYDWSVEPSGVCGLPGAGDEIKINCSQTGTYTVTVKVRNADRAQAGTASRSVNISISGEEAGSAPKAKDSYEKLAKAKTLVSEGRLDEGISLADEAAGLDPKNTESKTISEKWKKERDEVKQNITKFDQFIKDSRLAEAEKELEASRKLHPKYQPVVDAEKRLKEKKAKADRQKKDVSEKLAQAKSLAQKGNLDEAIRIAEEAGKTDQKAAEPVLKQFAQESKNLGWRAVNDRDFKTAVKRLEEAARLNPDDNDAGEKLRKAEQFSKTWDAIVNKEIPEFDRMINEKRPFSAHRQILRIQERQHDMPGGGSSEVLKGMNERFHTAMDEYNAFSQEAGRKHSEYFKSEDWDAMLRSAKEMTKREMSPVDEKEAQSRIQFAQQKLAERNQAWSYYLGVKALLDKGDIRQASGMLNELKNKPQYFMKTDPRRQQILDLIAAVEKGQEVIAAKGYAVNLFQAGEMYLRDYHYAQAAEQFAAGLKAMSERGDIKDPDYAKYYKLLEDCIVKDKRLKALWPGVQTAAMDERPLPLETIQKALRDAGEMVSLQPNNTESQIYKARLEQKVKNAEKIQDNKARADNLWKEGADLFTRNRPAEALGKFKESLKNHQDAERQKYVKDLEAAMAQKKAQADTLRKEGGTLQQQGRLREAADKYKASLRLWHDPALEEHIAKVENEIRRIEEKNDCAKKNRDEGAALQQKGLLREALEKYKASYACNPSPEMAEHMKKIEKTLAQTAKPTQPPQPTQPPTAPSLNLTGSWTANCGDRESYTVRISHSGNSFNAEVDTEKYSGTIKGNLISGRSSDQTDTLRGEIVSGNEISIQMFGRIGDSPYTNRCTLKRDVAGSQSSIDNSKQKRSISVTLKNASKQNVHIYPKGETNRPDNRLASGESRKVSVAVPSDGQLQFCAGRNGRDIECARKGVDAGNSGYSYTVTFNEDNPFNKLIISTGLR